MWGLWQGLKSLLLERLICCDVFRERYRVYEVNDDYEDEWSDHEDFDLSLKKLVVASMNEDQQIIDPKMC